MRESFKYHDGIIYVSDNEEGLLEYKYQDNIKEILKCENDIEEIKRFINEAKSKVNEYSLRIVKNPVKKHKLKIILFIFITLIVNIYFFNIAPSIFHRIIDLVCITSIGLSLPTAYLLSDFENNKKYKKHINENLLRKEKFEQLLIEKEKRLDELKKDKSIKEEEKYKKSNFIKKIDVIKDLQDVYRLDYVYTECGYNLEKIIDLYKKGQLDSWISCLTDLGERNLVKKIVKQIATEDGPKLLKKYK